MTNVTNVVIKGGPLRFCPSLVGATKRNYLFHIFVLENCFNLQVVLRALLRLYLRPGTWG